MATEWELKRGIRKSFFCPTMLWDEMVKETKGCYSVSQYIRFAIIEKFKREHPENSEYYDEISRT